MKVCDDHGIVYEQRGRDIEGCPVCECVAEIIRHEEQAEKNEKRIRELEEFVTDFLYSLEGSAPNHYPTMGYTDEQLAKIGHKLVDNFPGD